MEKDSKVTKDEAMVSASLILYDVVHFKEWDIADVKEWEALQKEICKIIVYLSGDEDGK